jgi:predicted metal-dependent hydrolase
MKQYKDIEYTLTRSGRKKTISIFIERDGKVSVRAPESLDMDKIEEILESKRLWIYKGLAEWEDLNTRRVEREFVAGESFLYLGRNYRLQIVTDQPKPLILKNGHFKIKRGSLSKAEELFKTFYREKGTIKIKERINAYRGKMGATPNQVRVMELKHRWASCSAKGNLNFHWKCVQLPLSVLDYVVVHELTHLIHKNHTKVFWNQIDKVLPDYQERKQWLKVNGAGMGL